MDEGWYRTGLLIEGLPQAAGQIGDVDPFTLLAGPIPKGCQEGVVHPAVLTVVERTVQAGILVNMGVLSSRTYKSFLHNLTSLF